LISGLPALEVVYRLLALPTWKFIPNTPARKVMGMKIVAMRESRIVV